MISPPNDPAQFGQIAVGDWPVLVAPEATAAIVARAKGIHVQTDRGAATWFTSLSILFSDTRFGGSTIETSGMRINDGEWAITGGTGQFATARGTIKFKEVKAVPQQSYKQLDIHAYYIPSDVNTTGSTIKYYTELSSA
uniref:Uncharacterized protein n=1 Tax=Avena sativa TaxID=4498 RepID=A0ACD5UX37_AVESA